MEKPKLLLMNSANMPTTGVTYRSEDASQEEIRELYWHFKKTGQHIESHIAYTATAKALGKIVKDTIPIDKAKTLAVVNPGDVMIVLRLPYRVPSNEKGHITLDEPESYSLSMVYCTK